MVVAVVVVSECHGENRNGVVERGQKSSVLLCTGTVFCTLPRRSMH